MAYYSRLGGGYRFLFLALGFFVTAVQGLLQQEQS
jgi:hypothetical protein